jgi:hypothetical protein
MVTCQIPIPFPKKYAFARLQNVKRRFANLQIPLNFKPQNSNMPNYKEHLVLAAKTTNQGNIDCPLYLSHLRKKNELTELL